MKITIKKRTLNALSFTGIISLLLLGLSLSIFTYSFSVMGINNSSVLVKVNITNTEPILYFVTVTPDPVELSPGENTTINCTGRTWDYNGWGDIVRVNATIYKNTTSVNAVDDNNNHYTNKNCSACTQYSGSASNATCSCFFNVTYYVDNGTWECNMTVFDTYGVNASNKTQFAINQLLAINTTEEVDYGNLVVTQTSSKKSINITNFGNIPLNLSLRSYGGTEDTSSNQNWAMICIQGNMTFNQHRWTLNATLPFDNMTPLSNDTVNMNLTIPSRVNDTAVDNDKNQTYIQLRVPLTVGGYCNGTLIFSAYASS